MPRFNDYIKKPNQKLEYTPELINELEKCANDFFYFCKYVQVKHPDYGRIQFEPRWYQREFLEKILNSRYFVGLLSRQVGKTLSVSVYILWYAMFHGEKTIGIVSNKQASATKILSEIKKMYEYLPSFIKCGVKIYNMTSIEFDNNTTIIVSATTEDPFRSFTINLLFADELAFINSNTAESFWASNFPTLAASEQSQVIVISTPNGMHNLFYRIYKGAERNENGFDYYKADWRVIEGRDENWKQKQIKILGKVKFEQEHGVSFLGSSNTVVDKETLEQLPQQITDPIQYDLNGKLRIWEKPQKDTTYIIGTDIAKGTGEHYSTCQILKVLSSDPFKAEQVAVFQDNYTDVYTFSSIVHRLALYYNNAFIMVENNIGDTVISQLWWEFEYDNLVCEGSKSTQLGIRATTKTKPKAVLAMKKLIEDGDLIINDIHTVNELTSFIDKGNNRFGGKDLTDDLISALYWATYITFFDILEEGEFRISNEVDDDAWGILTDVNGLEEDFSWLDNINM